MEAILNNRNFILTVRTIGRCYFILFFINLVFYGNRLSFMPTSNWGVVELALFIMAVYKVDISKMPKLRRLTEITIIFLMFILVCIKIMFICY